MINLSQWLTSCLDLSIPQIGRRLIQKGADVCSRLIDRIAFFNPLADPHSSLIMIQINSKDRANQHPLHRAATTGSDGFVTLLLAGGSDGKRTRLNTQDRMGESAACFNPLDSSSPRAHTLSPSSS